jgi:uncharacterized protein YbcC (UPF0753/DUF2309 family)
VVQGNGGDIKMGLPLQSVMESDVKCTTATAIICRHTSTSFESVRILLRNEHLKNLLDNEWIYLMVMDPLDGNKMHQYQNSIGILLVKKQH